MKSFARPSFWRAYEQLDERTREAARRAYRLFEQNPEHTLNAERPKSNAEQATADRGWEEKR